MEWKDVVGYEGIYEVSRCGEVRTEEGKTTFSKLHGRRVWKQRVLKQKVSKDNNCRVSLWKCGKERTWLFHRLVAIAFIPRIEGKEYINHIDGSRLNNHVDNLEWCNHEENNNHAFDNRLIKTSKSVVLVNKNSKESIYFRSLSKASIYLGHSDSYLSALLKRGISDIEKYEIYEKVN